jgi:hypothetical protein
VFGELTVPCKEPRQAACIVLGTVEVEDGCLVRVCNCPRTYVWSFASFLPVLFATIYGGEACTKPEDLDEQDAKASYTRAQQLQSSRDTYDHPAHGAEETCCATFQPDNCLDFVRSLAANGKAAPDVATALPSAWKAVVQSLQNAYSPLKQNVMSPYALIGKKASDLERIGLDLRLEALPLERPLPDLLSVLQASAMGTPQELSSKNVFYMDKKGVIVDTAPRPADYQAQIDDLKQQLAEVQAKLGNLPEGGGSSSQTDLDKPKKSSRKTDT